MGQVERDIGRHPFCKIIGLLMNTLLFEVENGYTWPQIIKSGGQELLLLRELQLHSVIYWGGFC
jgi:hypothetical protein